MTSMPRSARRQASVPVPLRAWFELTDVGLPLVSLRATFVFEADGAVMVSDSMLRFPERDEVTQSLRGGGFVVEDVRDAADRPGLELVFIARRPDDYHHGGPRTGLRPARLDP
jgi:hypothetical protein